MDDVLQNVMNVANDFGLKLLAAVAIFLLGRWAAKLCRKLIRSLMERAKVDTTLVAFTGNLIYAALLAFVVVAALGKLGIQTASFIAVLGAAGLAVGLALQGSLSNFAAGVLLIIFRPIRVGDFIEGAGTAGTVEEVEIFTTRLTTPDNKTIIIPNDALTGSNIVNHTRKGTRRVDMVFGIGYGDDIDKAKGIIREVIESNPRVLKDPAPKIALSELADSSVNFVARPWVKSEDYWDALFEITETVKKRFDAEGVSIPFPQRDVHIYQHSE